MPRGGKRKPILDEPNRFARAEETCQSKAAALVAEIFRHRMEQAHRLDKLRQMGNRLRAPSRRVFEKVADLDAVAQRADDTIKIMVQELNSLLTDAPKISPKKQLEL